jgi:hypothetical protein
MEENETHSPRGVAKRKGARPYSIIVVNLLALGHFVWLWPTLTPHRKPQELVHLLIVLLLSAGILAGRSSSKLATAMIIIVGLLIVYEIFFL